MKYVVIGNCQIWGIAKSIEFIDEGAEVTIVNTTDLSQYPDHESIVRAAKDGDIVFCQHQQYPIHGTLSAEKLKKNIENTIILPHIFFGGYHPDQAYVHAVTKAGSHQNHISGPTLQYHSAIALFAFINDLTVKEALSLYNEEVYRFLGYYDMWGQSQDFLLSSFKQIGFDGADLFFEWVAGGPFMYVNNHPTIAALFDVTARGLKMAGATKSPPSRRPRDYIAEYLNHVVWPIYPEIAIDLGVDGEYVFKTLGNTAGSSRYLGLEDFIASSYGVYQQYDKSRFECEHLAEWSRKPGVNEHLMQVARKTVPKRLWAGFRLPGRFF